MGSKTYQPTCDELVATSWRGNRCGKPAVMIGVKYSAELARLCKQHVGVEARRKYKQYREVREATPAEQQMLQERDAELARRNAELVAKKRVEAERSKQLYAEQRKREAAREWLVVRDDEHEFDWASKQDSNVPSWKLALADESERIYGETRVTVKPEGELTVIEVRNSSKLDVNEARALLEALTLALAEATK